MTRVECCARVGALIYMTPSIQLQRTSYTPSLQPSGPGAWALSHAGSFRDEGEQPSCELASRPARTWAGRDARAGRARLRGRWASALVQVCRRLPLLPPAL